MLGKTDNLLIQTVAPGLCILIIIIIFSITVTFYSPLGATQALRLRSSFDHLDSSFIEESKNAHAPLVTVPSSLLNSLLAICTAVIGFWATL